MSQIRKQGIYNMIFSYAGVGIGFFVTVFKTQALSSEEIGLVSLLLSISSILIYGMLIGTPNIIMKFLPSVKNDDHEKTGFLIFLFLIPVFIFMIISFFYFGLKDYIINGYIENPKFSEYYYFVLYFTFLNGFFQNFDLTCRSLYKSVFPNFMAGFFQHFLHFLILLIVFSYNLNFKFYFYLYCIVIFLKTGLLLIYLLYNINIVKPTFLFINKLNLKKYFTYGLFMLIAGLAGTLTTKIDKIMLGYFDTLSNVGIYTIAISIGNVLGIIGGSLSRIAHPKIAQAWEEEDLEQIERVYKSSTNLQVYLGIFVFSLFLFFADDILLFLGSNYIDGYLIMIFIALGQLINISTGMCGGIIAFSKYYKFDFYIRLFLIIINVIMNYLLIPNYGMLGAAIATAFSLAVYNILKVLFVYYKFSLQPYNIEMVKIFFASTIYTTFLYFVNNYHSQLSIFNIILYSILSFIFYNVILIFFMKSKVYNVSMIKNFMNDIFKFKLL